MSFIRPNEIHRFIHRPRSGWDPVPETYANKYSEHEWNMLNREFVTWLEKEVRGFSGKRILDLGGGPGHYSVEFAKRGGQVTWHDISYRYLNIAKNKSVENKVSVEFSLGYLEDAVCYANRPFDLVFNRVCWNYCIDDCHFAHLIYALVKPHGYAYLNTATAGSYKPKHFLRKLQYFLNDQLEIKIGHPLPPSGRIKNLFLNFPIRIIEAQVVPKQYDRLFFQKIADKK